MPDTTNPNPNSLKVGDVVVAIATPIAVVTNSYVVPIEGRHRIIKITDKGRGHAKVAEIKEDGSEEPVYATFHLSSFKPATKS